MMRTITLLALSFMVTLANAQEIKMKPLAHAEIVVSYDLDQLCDTPNQWNPEGWREKSTLMLEIGKEMAHSYVNAEHRDLTRQFIMHNDKNRWNLQINIHALVGETFIGYPEADKLTQIVNLDAAGVYQHEEPVLEMKWLISSEHKIILGYDCQLATVSFRGRDYKAWFTTDIPLSYGPWKFHGLPGLILEVADTKNDYHFTATGIEHAKDDRNIMMFDEEMRSTTRSRTLKMEAMLHKDHGAFASDYGFTFILGGGMEHDEQPYHPLELK